MAPRPTSRQPKAKPGEEGKPVTAKPATPRVAERIRALGGWRAALLTEVRRLIHAADPDIEEECKWIKPSNPLGVPVWSHAGIVCTGEAYRQKVKLTFAKGASLPDPRKLFNSSLDGNTRRAIDLQEGDALDAEAFRALVQAAVAANFGSSASKSRGRGRPATPSLLSGGNPQIAKADGDAPVQAYLAAMPGWKRDVGGRLDALITATVPHVRKAVRWNTPFYGIEGQGWFLAFHCMTKYIKVAFLRGTSLRPLPPVASRNKGTRYLHIHEDDAIDAALVATWIRQAAALPGQRLF